MCCDLRPPLKCSFTITTQPCSNLTRGLWSFWIRWACLGNHAIMPLPTGHWQVCAKEGMPQRPGTAYDPVRSLLRWMLEPGHLALFPCLSVHSGIWVHKGCTCFETEGMSWFTHHPYRPWIRFIWQETTFKAILQIYNANTETTSKVLVLWH